jgi:hypothetical protein
MMNLQEAKKITLHLGDMEGERALSNAERKSLNDAIEFIKKSK